MPSPTPNSEEPLNAPFGARCFLTRSPSCLTLPWLTRLNAPFGARCFLTAAQDFSQTHKDLTRLNAPFGARCFLTPGFGVQQI